jgi:hypothetical protein
VLAATPQSVTERKAMAGLATNQPATGMNPESIDMMIQARETPP